MPFPMTNWADEDDLRRAYEDAPRRRTIVRHANYSLERDVVTLEDHRAVLDASRRLTAALRHVGDRCALGDKAEAVAQRFRQPGVPDGRDPVGLVYALAEAVAVLGEALDRETAEASARVATPPTRSR